VYYLGSITAASGAYSNQQTGASGIGTFIIPNAVKSLYLVPQQSGILFELGQSTGATGSTFQTTLARGAQLDGPANISGPFRVVTNALNCGIVVSVYNSAGGFVSVRVYASPTQ
jgi:hypothetical protein